MVKRPEKNFCDFTAFLTFILINWHFILNESLSSHISGRIFGYMDSLSGEQLWLHRMDRHSPLQPLSFVLPFGRGRHLDLVLVLLLAF